MSTQPITHPMPGEQVVGIAPDDVAWSSTTWLRRPNLFPGRALTAPVLGARSAWASGRLVERGQGFVPGVVRGMAVSIERGAAAVPGQRTPATVRIGAGQGLCLNGEDVVFSRAIEAQYWSLPVVAPPNVLDGVGGFAGNALQPRKIGTTLGSLLDARPGILPRAGILVLQPTQIGRSNADPNDPCDRCGCDETGGNSSFEDQRYVDSARLLFYAWPEDWIPLPAPDPRWRNRLANVIFDAERALTPGQNMPWEPLGVAVALLGLDGDYLPEFVDMAAVARRGGRSRHSLLQWNTDHDGFTPNARLPLVWQARMEQFAEQLNGLAGQPPDVQAQAFDRLPPCGLLGREALSLELRSSGFFPTTFDVDAVPLPMSQLDLAIRESAGLAALDLSAGERVRLLVPVSDAAYEPNLLLTETIDDGFAETLDRFVLGRARLLAGRQAMRSKGQVLLRALRGASAPPMPALGDDPLALESESIASWGPPPARGGHRSQLVAGLHSHGFDGATEALVVQSEDSLYTWVYLDPDNPPRTLMLEWRSGGNREHRAYWGENLIERGTDGRPSRLHMGDLPQTGRWLALEVPAESLGFDATPVKGMDFVLYDGRAAFAGSGVLKASDEEEGEDSALGWDEGRVPAGATADGNEAFDLLAADELLAPLEAHYGIAPQVDPAAGTDTASPVSPAGESEAFAALQADPLLEVLSDAERTQLPARGIEEFIAYLKSRADRADDIVDYGFVKVQTDLYRVRQLVLGTTEASRLAISPALAGIAQAETAVASHERISDFITSLRSQRVVNPVAPHGAAAPGGAKTVRSRAAKASKSSAAARAGGVLNFSTLATATTAPLATTSAFGTLGASATATGFDIREAALGDANTRIGARLLPGVTATVPGRVSIPPARAGATYTPVDVVGSTPLTGNINLRTISIADRLELPKSQKARDYATSTRHESVLALVRLADQLMAEDGGVTPGLFEDLDVWGLAGDAFIPNGAVADKPLRRSFTDFLNVATRATLFTQLLTAPEREQADEASFFSDSADMADRSIALFRQVEGRIKRYRDAIAACEAARNAISDQMESVSIREAAYADRLAEARHDVAVARALISEEQTRIDAVNVRRAQVLASEVTFIAFVRPRATSNAARAPSRPLDPGLVEASAPACLREHGDVPDELVAMLAVVREAPAAWFSQGPSMLDRLDRVELLVKAVQTTQLRTVALSQRVQTLFAPSAVQSVARSSGLLASISQVREGQGRSIATTRAASLTMDSAVLGSLTWQGARTEAAKVVSLGDLIDGEHGQGAVARNAAAFFDRFSQVCACLHAGFSEVLPTIRLEWAESLSQFDEAPSLRNLSALPRWPQLDGADRRRLQQLVDWLFGQLAADGAAATGLVNDVVRMCLLLASHAPVGRIIAGRLPRPATVRPGVYIPLEALDPSRLRIGMHALVYRDDRIVARAVVEDLTFSQAMARVTHTETPSLELDTNVRVQFAEPSTISLALRNRVGGG